MFSAVRSLARCPVFLMLFGTMQGSVRLYKTYHSALRWRAGGATTYTDPLEHFISLLQPPPEQIQATGFAFGKLLRPLRNQQRMAGVLRELSFAGDSLQLARVSLVSSYGK